MVRGSTTIVVVPEVSASPVSNQIRRLRFEHGEMTQQALAERIGVTRQTVNAIELGKYSPSLEEVERELAAQAPIDAPLVKQDLLALPMREAREHFERAYLQQQLQLCGGKVGQLAKRVGMERTHLYRKLRSLGIEISHGAED